MDDELAELEALRRQRSISEEEYQSRRARLVSAATRDPAAGGTAVFALGCLGGAVGVLMALLWLAVDGADELWWALVAIGAAGAGSGFAVAHFQGRVRRIVPWGLAVSAVVHLASAALFGLPGFVLLALAAGFAFFSRRARR
jgi:hypothetical protein